jgi:hypothetical protein
MFKDFVKKEDRLKPKKNKRPSLRNWFRTKNFAMTMRKDKSSLVETFNVETLMPDKNV